MADLESWLSRSFNWVMSLIIQHIKHLKCCDFWLKKYKVLITFDRDRLKCHVTEIWGIAKECYRSLETTLNTLNIFWAKIPRGSQFSQPDLSWSSGRSGSVGPWLNTADFLPYWAPGTGRPAASVWTSDALKQIQQQQMLGEKCTATHSLEWLLNIGIISATLTSRQWPQPLKNPLWSSS